MHHILECLVPLPGYRGLPPSGFPRSRPGVHIVQPSQDLMGGIQWRASIGEVGGGICRGCCRRCMCGGRWGGFQLRAYNGCPYPPGTSRTATSRCASHRSRGPLRTTSAIFIIQNGRQKRRRVCRWFRVWGSKVWSFSRAFGATRRAFDITVGVLIASPLLPSCARVLGRVLACRRLDLVLQLSLHVTLCQEGVLDGSSWGRLFFLEDCIWFLSTLVRQWIDADVGGLADFLLKETTTHDVVIKWKHFPRYWPFVRGIHRSPVNSPHKGQWRGALMFSSICAYINDWINNREAGDLRRHSAHCDVIVMRASWRNFGEAVPV